MLTPEQTDLLQRMRDDAFSAPAPFSPLGHWESVAKEFDGWFDEHGIGVVEDQPYNGKFASHPPAHSAYYAYACQLLYRHLLQRDQWDAVSKVQSALPDGSAHRVILDGRPMSWDTLISLDSLLTIAEVSPAILTEPCTVADLGAGWGRVGFALKQINPRCTYIIFDLPESLLISSAYLVQLMPTECFRSYDDVRTLDLSTVSLRDGCVWFAGAQEMGRIPDGSIDYLISTCSFQEMTADYVDAYFDLIGRVARTFYTLQIDGRYYPFKNDWRELLKREVSWSSRYFETVFEIGGSESNEQCPSVV